MNFSMDTRKKEAVGMLMNGCEVGVKSFYEYLCKDSAATGQTKDIRRWLRKKTGI